MKVSVRFEGGAELAQALPGLSTRLNRKVMREVLTEAAEPIRKSAASLAPHEPGKPDLRDDIVISIPQKSQYLDLKSEVAAVAVGPGKRSPHGFHQELGTRYHGAQPFLRPAFDANSAAALKIVSDAAWRELAGRGIQRPTSVVDTVVEGEV